MTKLHFRSSYNAMYWVVLSVMAKRFKDEDPFFSSSTFIEECLAECRRSLEKSKWSAFRVTQIANAVLQSYDVF